MPSTGTTSNLCPNAILIFSTFEFSTLRPFSMNEPGMFMKTQGKVKKSEIRVVEGSRIRKVEKAEEEAVAGSRFSGDFPGSRLLLDFSTS